MTCKIFLEAERVFYSQFLSLLKRLSSVGWRRWLSNPQITLFDVLFCEKNVVEVLGMCVTGAVVENE